MITQLTIKNFKKFNELSIRDLGCINLFVGNNNVGKTTSLEAVMGFASGRNLGSVLNFSVWHRFPQTQDPSNAYLPAELLVNVFHDSKNKKDLSFSFSGIVGDKEKEFHHKLTPGQVVSSLLSNERAGIDGTEIIHRQVPMPFPISPGSSVMIDVPSQYLGSWEVDSEGAETVVCELSTPLQFNRIPSHKSFIPAMFHDFTTHRNEQEVSKVYAYLQSHEIIEEFIKELNESFSDFKIIGIDNIPYPDGSNAPIKIKFSDGRRHPIYALGDGFRRWYELLGSMLTFPHSVHCIEEADAALHYNAQKGFSVNLMKYAKKHENQIFLTTHSKEYLMGFLDALEMNSADDLKTNVRIITLRQYDDSVRHRTLDGMEALKALRQGLELRI